MDKKSTVISFIGIFAALFLMSGCLAGNRVAIEKDYFALGVKRSGEVSPPATGATLRIKNFRVAARYRSKGFIYRTADTSYETDFYNEFLIPPGELITENVEEWLIKSGIFQNIVDSTSYAEPTHILEGVVQPIYGDYRNKNDIKAVLGLKFFLLRDLPDRSKIVFKKEYQKEIPLKDKSPKGLVKGWNEALKQILTELEKDLRGVDLKVKS